MKSKFKFLLILMIVTLLVFSSNLHAKNIEEKDAQEELSLKPIPYGIIFGQTYGIFDMVSFNLRFVKLSFENRTRFSGLFCYYIIGRLEIGREYEITASKKGFCDATINIKLTKEKPFQLVNIGLWSEDW